MLDTIIFILSLFSIFFIIGCAAFAIYATHKYNNLHDFDRQEVDEHIYSSNEDLKKALAIINARDPFE